jgi:hypothetical protein
VPVLTDIDDLQVQLVTNRMMSAAARVCLTEGMNGAAGAINEALYGAGDVGGACAANDKLARDSDATSNQDDTILRVVGLRVGLSMGAGAQTLPVAKTWKGLFDNSGTTLATDRRLRREMVFFVGLPNAAVY